MARAKSSNSSLGRQIDSVPSSAPNEVWKTQEGVAALLNTIKNGRDENGNYYVSEQYRNSVPDMVVKKVGVNAIDNLIEVGNPIVKYTANNNEFVNALINRIGFTYVRAKSFYNKLWPLKKGGLPLGDTIQEIGINPAEANTYSLCSENAANNFFACCTPDAKAAYHKLNRQDVYCVSIAQDDLMQAFVDWRAFGRFVDGIILSLYNGDEIDEFRLAKNLFWTAYQNGHIQQVVLPAVTDAATATDLVREIRYYVEVFTEPSTDYNAWSLIVPGESYQSWSNSAFEMLLIINARVASYVDVDVLASAFNIDKVSYLANQIVVKDFGPGSENLMAVLCDITWPQIWDVNRKVTDFYDPSQLTWKFWLHHWQIYSFSPFANAIAFVTEEIPPQPPETPDLVNNITLSGITLTPDFDPDTTSYTGTTDTATTTIVVSSNFIPIIIFNSTNITNGQEVTLNSGVNVFNITVSDGTSYKQYVVNITYTPPAE